SRLRHVILRKVDLQRYGQSLAILALAVVVEEKGEVEPPLMKGVEDHGLPDERLAPVEVPRIGRPGAEVADYPGAVRIESEGLLGGGVEGIEVRFTHVADDRQRVVAVLVLRIELDGLLGRHQRAFQRLWTDVVPVLVLLDVHERQTRS